MRSYPVLSFFLFSTIVGVGAQDARADKCSESTFKRGAGNPFILKTGPYLPHRSKSYGTPASLKAKVLWKTEMQLGGRSVEVYVECKGLKPKRNRRTGKVEVVTTAAKGCSIYGPKYLRDLPAVRASCSISDAEARTVAKAVQKDRDEYWVPYFNRKKGKKSAKPEKAVASADLSADGVASEGLAEKLGGCVPLKDSVTYKVELKAAVGSQCNFNPAEVGKKTVCAAPAECNHVSGAKVVTTLLCLSDEKGACPDFTACSAADDFDRDVSVAVAGATEEPPIDKDKSAAKKPAATTEPKGDPADDDSHE